MQNDIPCWLKENEEYTPPADKDSFIDSSIKSVLSALTRLRSGGVKSKTMRVNTALRLFGIFSAVILTSLCRNFYFVFIMVAVTLALLAISDGKAIRGVLKAAIPAVLFSVIILLPSVLTGNTHTILSVTLRVFVSVSLLARFNLTTPQNRITAALRKFMIPDIIILTLDTTIHYIYILGEICFNMLNALKVRSIGKNNDKSSSLSGITGTILIKSKENAVLTAQAMECRGFSGKYKVKSREHFGKFDLIYIAVLALMVAAFIYFQEVI